MQTTAKRSIKQPHKWDVSKRPMKRRPRLSSPLPLGLPQPIAGLVCQKRLIQETDERDSCKGLTKKKYKRALQKRLIKRPMKRRLLVSMPLPHCLPQPIAGLLVKRELLKSPMEETYKRKEPYSNQKWECLAVGDRVSKNLCEKKLLKRPSKPKKKP